MKNKIFNELPVFTANQLLKQGQKQIKFLKLMHPALDDLDQFNQGAMEIRPLKRLQDVKYIRSYNTWRLEDKDIDSLNKFLNLLNGQAYCVYFSGFAFDYHATTFDKKGKERQKGRINNDNALYTTILPMDFDNITYDDFLIEKQKLMELGIETVDIFTGHGFQSFILLSQKVLDKDIYKKFTKLMSSKGFKVDEALVDAARVLRMPFTFNCKTFDSNSKHFNIVDPEIIPTTVINYTDARYRVVDVFNKINSLEDVIVPTNPLTTMDIDTINTAPLLVSDEKSIKKIEKIKKDIEILSVKTVQLEDGKRHYTMIHFDSLPDPIQKMLLGSQEGIRNDVMLFLIPFLKNTLGCSIDKIVEIMTIWGRLCKPSLSAATIKSEVERLYAYDLKGKHGRYTDKLAKAYGYLQFDVYNRDNKVLIPNAIFEDFDVINDGAIKIYLAIKLNDKKEGNRNYTINELIEITGVARSTFLKNIKDLISMGYICKKRANRRIKDKYEYYINPYFSLTKGFTMLETATLRLMLMSLTDGEMKLYAYLCYMIGATNSNCWASQIYLAKAIGKKGQSSLSKMTDKLADKKFIVKTTTNKNGFLHTTYTLFY